MLRLIAICVVVVSSSCATLQPPLTSPKDGGATWVEARSPHFVVHTDLPESAARERVVDLERIHALLSDLAFRSTNPPNDVVEVIVFQRRMDFAEFARARWVGGYSTVVDVDNRPRLVMPGYFGDREREVLQHELTHRFIRYFMPSAPVWLNEGMAKFYETLRVDGDNAVLGRSPYSFIRGDAHGISVGIDNLMSASALVALRPNEFYKGTGEEVEDRYAASWFLVSMLITGPDDDRKRFWAYISDMTAGAAPLDAWRAHFATAPIDDEFHEYRKAGRVLVERIPYREPEVNVEITTRSLADDEVRVLWASLAPKSERAANEVRVAARENPKSAEAHYWLGQWNELHNDFAAATVEYKAALALQPTELRYLLQVADMQLQHEVKKPKHDRDFASMRELVDAIAAFSDRALAQAFVGRYCLATGDVDGARERARKSIELDPTCWPCFAQLARIEGAAGNLVVALYDERQAIALLPHGVDPPKEILAELATFEAKAGSMPSAHVDAKAPAESDDGSYKKPDDKPAQAP